MQYIQKMEAGKFYVLESSATANSVYFETDMLANIFFRYCNYYLKDYLDIRDYCLNRDGWTMLIKTKSRKTIRKHYADIESRRKTKKNTTENTKPKEIWRILSERVRLFISSYVRMSNSALGRTGTLVRRKYSRYLCDDFEAAQAHIRGMRTRQIHLAQPKKKYRGLDTHFRMSMEGQGLMLQSSSWANEERFKDKIGEIVRGVFGSELPVFNGLGKMVVLNRNFSNENQKSPKKPPNPL